MVWKPISRNFGGPNIICRRTSVMVLIRSTWQLKLLDSPALCVAEQRERLVGRLLVELTQLTVVTGHELGTFLPRPLGVKTESK